MTEISKRVQLLIALLFALSLVLAGCGGGDSEADASENTATTDDAAAADDSAEAAATEAPEGDPSAPAGSAAALGVTAGQDDASGTVGGQDLTARNEAVKKWNVYGFKYAKKADGTYSAAEHNDISDWDGWVNGLPASDVATLLGAIPDGYYLEVRGHSDKSGPAEAMGSKPGNYALSLQRGQGVAMALCSNDQIRQYCEGTTQKLFYSGVGSDQHIPDDAELPNGRSRKNRRVTFHIVAQ